VGGGITADELWSCSSCGLCSAVCPAYIDFNSLFARLKRNQTLTEGSLPTEVKTNLVRVNRSGSLYGAPPKGFDLIRESGGVRYDRHEWFLFAGCALKSGRNLDALKSFLSICRRAGVSVGMLPHDENCCGDYALRAGDDLLFEQSATRNIELFAREGITRIVTLCPHGYNALRKDYRALAKKSGMNTYASVEIMSHVELMATLLREQRINLRHNPGRHIAWHDPCFLGRYNDLYHEPRELLRAVAGPFLVEMFHSREHGFCCGAYGAHHSSESMSEFRVRETVSSGATMLISGCAHCRMGFDAAISRHQLENIETMDIATYIAENMN
jgi:Fe-S oxidoreductase